jgi:predicted MFS family arabinose efflux permease
MMLAGPYLLTFGWPALWLVNGVLALAWAAVVACVPLREPPVPPSADSAWLANVKAALGTPGPAVLALIFGTYTFQYMALAGLLPTLLVERGLSIYAAGTISALAVLANAVGNMSAGILLRLGVPIWSIVAAAFAFLVLAGFGVFAGAAPIALVAALASLSLALTGMIPGSIHAAAPKLAPTSALLAIVLGLISQVTNIGNLFGPAAMALLVDTFGWQRAPWFFAAAGVTGLALALLLRAAMRRVPR